MEIEEYPSPPASVKLRAGGQASPSHRGEGFGFNF